MDSDDLAAWGAIVRLKPVQVARTVRRVSQGELDVKRVRESTLDPCRDGAR